MELKNYQKKSIEKLNEYLKKIRDLKGDYETAFLSIMNKESENGIKYYNTYDVPFICMKMPTGGGKTLVACHSIVEIMSNYLQEKLDKGIVLWFAPLDEIKTQTLKKLRDKKDMHKQVLDTSFKNNIKIFSDEEALRIRKHDVEDNLCIIVASLDSFRKEEKLRNKYKVYKENGTLANFFDNLKDDEFLEKDESGVIFSLANVIRMYNPLIVVDEGHRTKTKISIDFLKDLNPSFIIEYTATPREGSNLLVNVHSQELKKEQMVKIPLVLESKRDWREVIDDGFNQRKLLEDFSKKEKDYIRPIALFQAEPDRQANSITVDKIKEYLIKEKKISEEEIAIKISGKNELENKNLFAKNCEIRYIITISALAEGWDCSFAYVLVSVSNLGSKIAVEQIIGRIMRMPYAQKRINENLNKSYVFASAKNFQEAADQIKKGLEDNGYSKADVISSSEKDKKDQFVSTRKFKEDFSVPVFAFEDEKLSFGDNLLGDGFELTKQNHEVDFVLPLSEDGKGEIDITEEDNWKTGIVKQLTLNFGKSDKDWTEKDLVLWLDEKLRFKEIDRKDKIEFLEGVVKYLLDKKKFNLRQLSLNRYPLKENLDRQISKLMENFAKKIFYELLKQKKIVLKTFEKFPEEIELTKEITDQDYKKSYYDKIEKLNKEEKAFIDKLDLEELENIKFWIRCRERQEDSFSLQAWENRNFYPDFIALTDKGNILAFEWKGEDRVSNDDTKYKEDIGAEWEKLGKGKLYFFLVHNGNVHKIMEEVEKL